MNGSKEFVDQFGGMSFEEKEFCDGDAISFCEIVYMPFANAVSSSFDDELMSFPEACSKVFESRGNRHYSPGLLISKGISERMMQMAEQERYRNVKIGPVRSVYSYEPAIQFTAVNFILPDGTCVVTFEGTDDTIAGWKEDLDILTRRATPAYKYALDFLENVAEKFDGQIIILGHSKGGNEALYSVLKCSQEVRDRVKYIYNNDGPGFFNYAIFRTGSYSELGDRYRHFVPSTSLVGMMLAHDYDYKAIKSSKHLGPFQHDMETWHIENGNLVTVEDVNNLAKVTDLYLAKLASRAQNEGYISAVDSVMTDLLAGLGQETLTDLVKHAGSAAKGAVAAWKCIEPDVKKTFIGAFKGSAKMIKDSIDAVKTNVNMETAKNHFDEVKEMLTA